MDSDQRPQGGQRTRRRRHKADSRFLEPIERMAKQPVLDEFKAKGADCDQVLLTFQYAAAG